MIGGFIIIPNTNLKRINYEGIGIINKLRCREPIRRILETFYKGEAKTHFMPTCTLSYQHF
jgi:hypothetical protein